MSLNPDFSPKKIMAKAFVRLITNLRFSGVIRML